MQQVKQSAGNSWRNVNFRQALFLPWWACILVQFQFPQPKPNITGLLSCKRMSGMFSQVPNPKPQVTIYQRINHCFPHFWRPTDAEYLSFVTLFKCHLKKFPRDRVLRHRKSTFIRPRERLPLDLQHAQNDRSISDHGQNIE